MATYEKGIFFDERLNELSYSDDYEEKKVTNTPPVTPIHYSSSEEEEEEEELSSDNKNLNVTDLVEEEEENEKEKKKENEHEKTRIKKKEKEKGKEKEKKRRTGKGSSREKGNLVSENEDEVSRSGIVSTNPLLMKRLDPLAGVHVDVGSGAPLEIGEKGESTGISVSVELNLKSAARRIGQGFLHSNQPFINQGMNNETRKRSHLLTTENKYSNNNGPQLQGSLNQMTSHKQTIKEKDQKKHNKNFEQSNSRRSKKFRLNQRRKTTQEEKQYLREKFIENSKPSPKEMQDICNYLQWDIRRLNRWFGNQRSRTPKDSLLLLEKKETEKMNKTLMKLKNNGARQYERRTAFLKHLDETTKRMGEHAFHLEKLEKENLNLRENKIAAIEDLQKRVKWIQENISAQIRNEDSYFADVSVDDEENDQDDVDEEEFDAMLDGNLEVLEKKNKQKQNNSRPKQIIRRSARLRNKRGRQFFINNSTKK
ncbi:b3 domain-containing protein [Anaeramoeba flamelloides]|uniref:B3 domain-containing protein n=1 Tax=Anaeramoeba flamelloides TaxID=1746091 RepID=A0ABQ8XPR9_9EUKA|nr:b3 domain-containing protein [Anaeramoeba flamelloides]